MIPCNFVSAGAGVLQCDVCGRRSRDTGHKVHAECRGPQPVGLGDMVKAGLSAIGITQERVAAVLGSCGGCQQRQEALNEFGRSLGIGRPDGTQEGQP
jgi:hypothetical protein